VRLRVTAQDGQQTEVEHSVVVMPNSPPFVTS